MHVTRINCLKKKNIYVYIDNVVYINICVYVRLYTPGTDETSPNFRPTRPRALISSMYSKMLSSGGREASEMNYTP